MFKSLLVLIALAFLVSGCTSPEERQAIPKKEPVIKAAQKKVVKKNVEPKKAGLKKEKVNLCKNIEGLKKGMTLAEVHEQLGLGSKNKKYAFTKPFFYIKCYESATMISYAEFKFHFDEGCTFRKAYEPDEKEIKEMICNGRAGKLDPPEIFKY